jgi:hypothetical protein
MSVQRRIKEHEAQKNFSLDPEAYIKALVDAEKLFDGLVTGRAVVSRGNAHQKPGNIYRAFDLGEYVVGETDITAAVQPRRFTRPGRSDRDERELELWLPDQDFAFATSPEPLSAGNSDFIGSEAIYSVNRDATAASIASLLRFTELLDAVIAMP